MVLTLVGPTAAPAWADEVPSVEERQSWSIDEMRKYRDTLGIESQEVDLTPSHESTGARPTENTADAVVDASSTAEPVEEPAPGTTVMELATGKSAAVSGKAGGLPVALRAVGKDAAQGQVKVHHLDRGAADRLGAVGPVVELVPESGEPGTGARSGESAATRGSATSDAGAAPVPETGTGGSVEVSIDVSHLAGAGDLLQRATLTTFPGCTTNTEGPGVSTDKATRDQQGSCQTGTLARDVQYDPETLTISGKVTLPATAPVAGDADAGIEKASDISVASSQASEASLVVAVVADTAGKTGDWGATSLAPSSSWNVSTQTGAFSWAYPMRTPSVPGGLSPDLSLSYNSASLDGRVATTNNQSSLIGDGWEGSFSGYIERKYVPCADDQAAVDGKAANNASHDSGDLCWKSNNATLVFNGSSTELVRDGNTETWRPKNDNNSIVTHATGGWNTDNDTEYWTLTTTDGTKYWFGRDKRSASDTALGSSWVTQVYGNHPGEPCYQATFAASACKQTWRWNLDYVEDTSGNTMTYRYSKQNNNYGYNNNTGAVAYTRSGWLSSIEYGTRAGDLTTAAPAKVTFGYAERCLPTSSFDCADSKLTATNAAHWPDVPQDLLCTSSTSCANVTSPVFFDRKRLTNVTTQVRVGGAYVNADTWDLTQSMPDPGDGSNATVRLEQVLHTGRNGAVADKALPAVTFGYDQYENRVNSSTDLGPAMNRYRLTTVLSESGARTTVAYSGRECSPSNLPSAPETNTMRCQPVYWSPRGDAGPTLEYFHHYRVASVVEDPRLANTAPIETQYTYTGGPAWHYDDNPLVRPKYRTWGQLRGYSTVDVRTGETGNAEAPRLHSQYRYFRGLHGDKNGSGGTRSVQVDGINDLDQFAGSLREEITFDGSVEVSSTTSTPWRSDVTATDPEDADRKAFHIGIQEMVTRTAAPALPGGQRTTKVTTEFDSYGMPIKVSDAGDTARSGDERCTTTTYLRNTGKNILTTVQRVETLAASCADSASATKPDDVVSDQRFGYDGAAVGTAPTIGRATLRQEVGTYVSGAPRYVNVERSTYNAYGQQLTSVDAMGGTTSTAYTTTEGLTTAVKTTSPDPDGTGSLTAHVTTTVLDPVLSVPTKVTDANGKITTGTYDGLGRLTAVWEPGRVQGTHTATTTYAYTVSSSGANAVVTKTQNWDASAYVSSSVIYDGLLRSRQTQAPSASASAAGRVITDTMYDARGLATVVRDGWATTGAAGASLVIANGAVDSRTVTQYDGAGRPIKETFQVGGGEKPDDNTSYLPKWSTSTAYEGDRVHVDPPAGGTPTTTISDARGNTTELRQYTGSAPSGTNHVTTYRYDTADRLTSVSDPKGNAWTYTYDLRGRQIGASDPDKGDSTSTYDDLGNVVTTTDARGKTLAYTYDALGRKTTLRDSSATGTVRSRWVYDTKAKGQLTSSTRVDSTDEYTTTIGGYNDQYLPTSQTVTLPASLGAVSGTYTSQFIYTQDGRLRGQSIPAAGGLKEERMTVYYSAVAGTNAASGLSGGADFGVYVAEADYLPTGEVSYLDLGTTYAYQQAMYYQTGTRRLTGVTTTQETGNPDDQLHELQHLAYSYDDAGNVLSVKDTPELGGQPTDQQCFDYDWTRRLTDAWTPANGDCTAAPSVAGLGGAQAYWKSYSYDVIGNRTSTVLHRPTSAGGDLTSTYTRPASGDSSTRPHAVTSVTAKTTDQTLGTSSFTYDPAGNMTGRTVAGEAPQTLTWDAEGELASVAADQDTDGTVEPAESDEYLYSADGDRLVRHQGGTTTVYLPGQELTVSAAGTVSATRYYTFAGRTVAVRTGSWFDDVWSVIADPQNTGALQVRNVSGTVLRRYQDPFGADRASAAGTHDETSGTETTWVGDHGFLDKPQDTSGLTQVGARYYDPVLGAFVSVDPIMDLAKTQQWHGYAYSSNNPTTWSDPSGLREVANDGLNNDSSEDAKKAVAHTTKGGGWGSLPPVKYGPPNPGVSTSAGSTGGNGSSSSPGATAEPAESSKFSIADAGHVGLDALGLIPALGFVPDLVNCAWYGASGDAGNAAFSCGAAIPIVGDVAMVGKYTFKGTSAVISAANTAKSTAEAAAAARVAAGGRRIPTATAVAVDPVTGRVAVGFSGEKLAPPAALNSRLPDPSLEPWAVNNCAEAAACTRMLEGITEIGEQAAMLDRLQIYTVRTKTGEFFPPCGNCATWVPGQ
ncbi:RHS repeat-associated core domain-containing protein [Isoptericola sp. NPDC019693]|uniref:RHS repeat-associated core domain-containing protein n=1 Tax=Isoptericola sp. NPDC019693 TaxID=3364009 RepID=UPI00379E1D27